MEGQPIFKAMDPAGVFADITADGACDLGGWIRRIEKSMGESGFTDRKVTDTLLKNRDGGFRIHR